MSLPTRVVGDVSALPTHAFGPKSPMWWGTINFMLIEGTGFLLAGGAYFYLRGQVQHWPPASPPPDLLWGTLFTIVLSASLIPNLWLARQAKAEWLKASRIGVIIMTVIALALIPIRAMEFTALNERWDHNAYGSIIWALMLLHTTHIVTDFYDTGVLAVVMFTDPVDGKRFSDISDNALYWNFVVLSWLPIYALVYVLTRLS